MSSQSVLGKMYRWIAPAKAHARTNRTRQINTSSNRWPISRAAVFIGYLSFRPCCGGRSLKLGAPVVGCRYRSQLLCRLLWLDESLHPFATLFGRHFKKRRILTHQVPGVLYRIFISFTDGWIKEFLKRNEKLG